MLIADLLAALRETVRLRVRNGLDTERGLARRAGVSQPYLHNVLKGERQMMPDLADRLLRVLGLSVRDLIGQGRPPKIGPGRERGGTKGGSQAADGTASMP